MKTLFRRLVREEAGQDLVEYALLAAFISLAAIVAMGALGDAVSTLFDNVTTSLSVGGGGS